MADRGPDPGTMAVRRRVAAAIGTTDAVFDRLAEELVIIIANGYKPDMDAAALAVLWRSIDTALDRALGLTQASAPRSELYRVFVDELAITVAMPYAAAVDLVRSTMRQHAPARWAAIEPELLRRATRGTDRFAQVYADLYDRRGLVPRLRSEQLRVFDPQRRWVPRSKWTTKQGYRLSDRLWRGSRTVRNQIDRTIRRAIAEGMSPYTLTHELERYLRPGKQPVKYLKDGRIVRRHMSRRPGGWASSYARRLARTEIMRVHGAATVEAVEITPGMLGVRWRVSGSHPHPDVCDSNASRRTPLGIGVYTKRTLPRYPAHPNELCILVPVPVPTDHLIAEVVRRYGRTA